MTAVSVPRTQARLDTPRVEARKADEPKQAKYERFDLEGYIDTIDVAGKFERGNRPRDRIYASELGWCARAMWRSWHHPRPHDDLFSNNRGRLGHAAEVAMKEILRPVLVADEVSFTSDKVSGRVDFVIRMEKGGPQIPVELKTTYAFDRSMVEPFESNVLQLQFYLTQMPDAPFGFLCYMNLANYGGGSGIRGYLKVPRDDASVGAKVERLWSIVHDCKEEPACDADNPNDCFPCKITERTE